MVSFNHLAYSRFIKFSVAPESSKAVVSALFRDEWTYVRTVIDFRMDIYTLVLSLFLIKAELIRWSVTLLRALRPDVGGWVTLSPRYWTGVPSDGGRAPYSAVLKDDLSWSSKLVCCLSRQYKRMCAKAETSQRRVSK